MLKLHNFNTATQMLLAASVGLLCLLLIGFMGISSLSTINEQAEIMYERNMNKLLLANEARSVLQNLAILGPVYATNMDRMAFTTNLEKYEADFAQIMAQYETLIVNEQERELFQKVKSIYNDYLDSTKNLLSARNQAEAAAMGADILPKRVASIESMYNLIDYNMTAAETRKKSYCGTLLNDPGPIGSCYRGRFNVHSHL
ncbi:MAG: hypothetical protein GX750_06755 [Clostridia bacterium]|nr:hypothetical protein [Clostridia bacterium]